eukprot:scaffold6207_cov77-Skeletonema_dohrnii-CCMP3373.AAC.3
MGRNYEMGRSVPSASIRTHASKVIPLRLSHKDTWMVLRNYEGPWRGMATIILVENNRTSGLSCERPPARHSYKDEQHQKQKEGTTVKSKRRQ